MIPQAHKTDGLLMLPRAKDLLGRMTREVEYMVQAVVSSDAPAVVRAVGEVRKVRGLDPVEDHVVAAPPGRPS